MGGGGIIYIEHKEKVLLKKIICSIIKIGNIKLLNDKGECIIIYKKTNYCCQMFKNNL